MGDWTLAGVVRHNGAEIGEAPAITYGETTITWSELDRRSSRVAQRLLGAGVSAGDHVAMIDKNGPEFFDLLFGAGKIGAICVPVNWRLAPQEMQFIVNDAEARVLVVGPDFLGQLEAFEAGLEGVKEVVTLVADGTHQDFASWVEEGSESDPGTELSPEEVVIQLYTSGTTGLPKGAMLSNHNLGVLLQLREEWGLDPESVNLVAMPLFHIGGSGWALAGMSGGARSVLVREVVPAELLRTIQAERVTNAFLVPAVLQMLCALPGAADGDFSALRSIHYGASPITDQALNDAIRTFGCDLIQVYGLTETTGAITQLDAAHHDPDGPRRHLMRSAGRPYPWVELRVVDPETGTDRRPGEIGELWTRSEQNMVGYWHRPEANAEVFTTDGWFRTGDGGYLDEDGFVFLTDRIKDMIVSGGENIYPAEVENVLAGHPHVADVAVIGVPDERWGEAVKAMVVPRPGAEADAADIISYCRDRLAHYKCPRSVDLVAELPRNPSGKILKRELREPFWAGRRRRIN
ncbi:MAG TPA: long-chain-fatty-acid--CoA ligase [Acidimicrobiales bacterium]|nr:long-chain-fatty-acid--CoA ligase [Acidimicrobiales bacterium]